MITRERVGSNGALRRLAVQKLVHELDCDRSLNTGGDDAFDGARPHVAHGGAGENEVVVVAGNLRGSQSVCGVAPMNTKIADVPRSSVSSVAASWMDTDGDVGAGGDLLHEVGGHFPAESRGPAKNGGGARVLGEVDGGLADGVGPADDDDVRVRDHIAFAHRRPVEHSPVGEVGAAGDVESAVGDPAGEDGGPATYRRIVAQL